MILQSKRVWIAGQFVPAQIEMKDQKIVNILPWSTVKCDEDWGNNRILPGFIDIHTHGAYGFDTNDADPEGTGLLDFPHPGGRSYFFPSDYRYTDAGCPDQSCCQCGLCH